MTIERRHALLAHDHDLADFTAWGVLPSSGDRWGKLAYIGDDGVAELGKYLDFHETDADTDDFDFRITIASGTMNLSGQLVLSGAGMDMGSSPLYTGSLTSNWNEGAVDSYSAVTFKRGNTGLTNQPASYDNANMAVTFNYHGGGYARQFGFIDTPGGLYTRILQNGTWFGWQKLAMYSGATGYLLVDSYDTWTTSGWGRALSLRTGVGSSALQFYDTTRHWGLGSTGGTFYIMNTTSDTSAAPGMSYPAYCDASIWTFALPVNCGGSVSIPAGYGFYLGGYLATPYLADRTGYTYGSIRVGGSKNGYSGIFFDSSYQANGLMFNNGSNEWGLYSESGGWKFYYTGTTFQVQGGPYKPVPWHDFGGTAASARVTRGTGAGSGGSDGDVHYQYV